MHGIILVDKEEGYTSRDVVNCIGKIEKEHEERYKKLHANIEGGLEFSRDGDMMWTCSNCGHVHFGKDAPELCPVCAHPKAYFMVKAENY